MKRVERILFVCLGNICRSSAAEEIMRVRCGRQGLKIEVDSAGLIDYHEGELSDPRMRRHAEARGYRLTHRSRPVTREDFGRFNLIVAMDANNARRLRALAPTPDAEAKIVMAADYLSRHVADCIPDPYYSDDKAFDYVVDLLEDVCDGLVASIQAQQ